MAIRRILPVGKRRLRKPRKRKLVGGAGGMLARKPGRARGSLARRLGSGGRRPRRRRKVLWGPGGVI